VDEAEAVVRRPTDGAARDLDTVLAGDLVEITELLDVVGPSLTFEAQHPQDELANPTRLLAPLSLHDFSFVTLSHMDREVVALGICFHRSRC
jgi:hypothetical protein